MRPESLPSGREPRIVLVDPDHESREVMARRLRAQGYAVEATPDPAVGATLALGAPPDAVVSDLWMPSISGVQLCRLLRSEPATAEVPIILRGAADDPRSHFWAERAGAAAYIAKGRMAELARALAAAAAKRNGDEGFFMQLGDGTLDIRDRIAKQLDAALFESVIAGEVRALGRHTSFEQLFDQLSQLASQIIHYRWLAVRTFEPARVGLHHHPRHVATAEREACAALSADENVFVTRVTDEDARDEDAVEAPFVFPIAMGNAVLGEIALSPTHASKSSADVAALVQLLGRELAGPLRITALVEQSERLATLDALTGLLNRRAFLRGVEVEMARSTRYGLPLSTLLIDIDHFKQINDRHGHAMGDRALVEVSGAVKRSLRQMDVPCRWGGEELVVMLPNTDVDGALVVAERLRESIAALELPLPVGALRMTASVGVSQLRGKDSFDALIERADQAMYEAKAAGRNRVVVDRPASEAQPRTATELASVQH
jgi:diguanylate cyclase (GGDEF)-like protein